MKTTGDIARSGAITGLKVALFLQLMVLIGALAGGQMPEIIPALFILCAGIGAVGAIIRR